MNKKRLYYYKARSTPNAQNVTVSCVEHDKHACVCYSNIAYSRYCRYI